MRYVLIDPAYGKAFNCETPVPFGHYLICREIGGTVPVSIQVAEGIELWVDADLQTSIADGFRFTGSSTIFRGAGFLCGRTRMDDFKSLPRWLSVEAVSCRLEWPRFQAADLARAA